MADLYLSTAQISTPGALNAENGAFHTDGSGLGYVTMAGLIGGVTGGTGGTAITTGGTVSSATRIAKLNPGSAVTGIIVQSGAYDGQELVVLNVAAAASSITFTTAGSAAASSHVATDTVFSGQRSARFTWDVGTALWYPAAY